MTQFTRADVEEMECLLRVCHRPTDLSELMDSAAEAIRAILADMDAALGALEACNSAMYAYSSVSADSAKARAELIISQCAKWRVV